MKNKTLLILFVLVTGLFLPACTAAPNMRDLFYSGMAALCAGNNSAEKCNGDIAAAINQKTYENLAVKPATTHDAFYLGMITYCLDVAKNAQATCEKLIDEAIKADYLGQLGTPPAFPTPK